MSPVDRSAPSGRAYLDLQNRARREGRATQQLLTSYARERWLARLATSSVADRFVLKGGLLLAAVDVWPPSRQASRRWSASSASTHRGSLAAAKVPGVRLGRPQALPVYVVRCVVAERDVSRNWQAIADGRTVDAVPTARGVADRTSSLVRAVDKAWAAADLAV